MSTAEHDYERNRRKSYDEHESTYVENRSVGALVSSVFTDATGLITNEIKLARKEISDNLDGAANGAISIVAGLILIGAGLVVVLQAIVSGLVNYGLSLGWAALLVGGVVCVIGAIMLAAGGKQISPKSLAPSRTFDEHRKDRRMVKEQI